MKFARHLFEYLAVRAVLALLTVLPSSSATPVAMVGSRFLFACLPRLRRIGLRNLELAFPDLSPRSLKHCKHAIALPRLLDAA